MEAGESAPVHRPPAALGLELIKSPQDGSADAVVSLVLGSSYVVYHVAALIRLQDYFRTEQVRCHQCALRVMLCCIERAHNGHPSLRQHSATALSMLFR